MAFTTSEAIKAIEVLDRDIATAQHARRNMIALVVKQSLCNRCPMMSSPNQGTMPVCRDARNANYSRRIIDVTECARLRGGQA